MTSNAGSTQGSTPSALALATGAGGGALALVAGAAAGVAGTGTHQVVGTFGGIRWPVGVVIALALLLAVAATVRAASSGLVPTLLVAAGWLAVTGLGTVGGRGGDVIVPDNWRGTAWVLGGAVVLVAVLVRGRDVRSSEHRPADCRTR